METGVRRNAIKVCLYADLNVWQARWFTKTPRLVQSTKKLKPVREGVAWTLGSGSRDLSSLTDCRTILRGLDLGCVGCGYLCSNGFI